ncbi:Protein BREAST CANCER SUSCEPTIBILITY 2 B like [Actinidia chinensis var. chinensis]|uniref:Protein BREAST CANCER SUSCEPTIBILITY 2 B like n=1 Tax=Actinidia chinensis var. chinensis TaxID=1590841 RepID=A0A2R6RXH6_ACTCC|nr:Protein BREAST CANCER SUSCEPTIBILITY 2 B like [Actinidia chinensis var. chinensis]
MSTWQIFSDADNNFRWELSDQQLHIEPKDDEPGGAPLLPSMADLLLQGCSELMENGEGRFQSPPMFRSGLGKSVAVKQSSLAKALSIIGDEGDAFVDTGQMFNGHENGFSFSNSMFQTGSGKKVNISSTGLVRAKTLLGLEENYDRHPSPGVEHSKNQSTSFVWQNSSQLKTLEGVNNICKDATTVPMPSFNFKTGSLGNDSNRKAIPDLINSATKCPPIKFNTAGGRSISVSSDALQRAKSLLGDLVLGTLFNEEDVNNAAFLFSKQGRENHCNNKNSPFSTPYHQEIAKTKHVSKSFTSPLRSDYSRMQSSVTSDNVSLRSNLIKKFDAEDFNNSCKMSNNTLHQQKTPSCRPLSHVEMDNSLPDGVSSRISLRESSLGGPLVDISNKIGMSRTDIKLTTGEKRRLGRSSISSFKRPRSSRFITPLNKMLSAPTGLSTLAPEESCCRRRVSTQYPFQVPRVSAKEYFGAPSSNLNMLNQLPHHIRTMSPENAEKYMFDGGSGVKSIGAETFYHMLAQSGASVQYFSKEWIINHYKWIVWKLACYERCYPAKSFGKLLTVSNVLDELKYRYEREVNHGHRSAIKRILEGDQPPTSMLVLCISSIHLNSDTTVETLPMASDAAENGTTTKVELTDGWYSINALLDVLLLKKLATGKLFVGQKLRIWGAGLCGWVGPVSPLQVSSTVSLLLHINGTYRAHWADRLGLCKGGSAPLALRCIKSMGGPIPCTLVGVTRIYPVLYRERLHNGEFVVRSERMEAKMIQLYNQRCSAIAEGIMSEFQRGIEQRRADNDNDSEEGAKILKILETAAEPEVLMAEMTSEQLTSFATYQAKLEAIRQSDMQKSIDKSLEDAGLSAREVTRFMRVRVVGLTHKNYLTKCCPRKGLITIWNPTEKQQLELVEGKAYNVAGLIPLSSESDTLYLKARGSTSKWVPLSLSATEHFESFFTPRKSVLLSHLGEVPLSSEFDIAALVVYVGEVYTDAHQKKQWVFVTDGSISVSHLEEPSNSLLAISFCSPYIDGDSFAPINDNLVGSAVDFCNLIKRAKDQVNHLWVAEATENSTYFLSYDNMYCCHLKEAAASAEKWAKISTLTIEKLRRKVLSIIDNDEG